MDRRMMGNELNSSSASQLRAAVNATYGREAGGGQWTPFNPRQLTTYSWLSLMLPMQLLREPRVSEN
jgi:hypothetical protein